MKTTLIILIFITTNYNGGDSCLFKEAAEIEKHPNVWDKMTFKRVETSCECGKADPLVPDWNVNIQTKSKDNAVKKCTGTIVTSDLIVTSHKCLGLIGERMRFYGLIKFQNEHENAADKIIVSHPKDESKTFKVRNVFYNPQYSTSSGVNIYMNDVVILQVQADFTTEPHLKPVCVPFHDDTLDGEDIIDQHGTYYSPSANATDELDVFQGEVFKKKACYQEINADEKKQLTAKSANTTLCLRYQDDSSEIPKQEGGPLLVTMDSTKRTFLVGIADDVGEAISPDIVTGLTGSIGDYHTFFSGINPVVKFIEYHADNVQSKWCKTPHGKVLKTQKATRGAGRSLPRPEKPYPWDTEKSRGARKTTFARKRIKATELKRDESLDCMEESISATGFNSLSELDYHPTVVNNPLSSTFWKNPFSDSGLYPWASGPCGLQNTKIGGRVVGGVEATPREFGWMTNILLFPFGRYGAAALCGGAVINDRMILTAAHCVVSDQKLEADPRADATISPENVRVTLNAHLQQNDPNGIPKEVMAVIFHPDYLNSRLSYPQYYDSDIALLVLKDKLTFVPDNKRGIRPICLPEFGKYRQIVGKTAWVVGWGLTDPQNAGSTANKLQKLDVPIADLQLCNQTAISKVTDKNICAGSLDMYRDAAAGDSGGPLQIEDTETSQWYEVGAVSWGEDVTVGDKTLTAALYADVQKLMPFIDYHSQRVRAQWCKSVAEMT